MTKARHETDIFSSKNVCIFRKKKSIFNLKGFKSDFDQLRNLYKIVINIFNSPYQPDEERCLTFYYTNSNTFIVKNYKMKFCFCLSKILS